MRAPIALALALLVGCEDKPPTASPEPAPKTPSSSTGSSTGSATTSAAAAPAASTAPEFTLKAGDPAPDVELKLQDGTSVKLSSLKESIVLVYFYPKDDTKGCTIEAEGIRDNFDALTKAGVKVFGVSLQDAESHKAFIDKYDLPFPLAVDDGTLAKAFEVPVKGEYASRQSFLIGKDGKLLKVWREVKPADHAREVLEAAGA